MKIGYKQLFLGLGLLLFLSISPDLLFSYEFNNADSDYISKAEDYYNRGQLIKARSLFELALKKDPSNETVKRYLEDIDRKLSISGLQEDASIDIESLYMQGKQAFLAQDYATAVQCFSKVLKYMPNHQYAKRYLEKSRTLLANGGGSVQNIAAVPISRKKTAPDIEEVTQDSELLKTRFKVAVLSLQEGISRYLSQLKEIKDQQDFLMKKYLEEKEKQVRELEERIKEQEALVNDFSAERLKLQTQIARINEEILLLENRLMGSLSERTGESVSLEDLSQLDERYSRLTAEEKALRDKLRRELLLRQALEDELKKIEEMIGKERLIESGKQRQATAIVEATTRELTESLPQNDREKATLAAGAVKKFRDEDLPSPEKKHSKKKTNDRKLARLLKQGKRFYKKGQYEDAIEKFFEVIKKDSLGGRYAREAETLLAEARAGIKEKEKRLIEEKRKKIQRLNLFYDAQDAYYAGEMDRALELAKKVLEIDPGFVPAKRLLKLIESDKSLLLSQEKKISPTSKVFTEKAEESHPELRIPSREAGGAIAELESSLQKIEEEEAQKEREYIANKIKEVSSYLDKKEFDKAIELLTRLSRLYPDNSYIKEYLTKVKQAKYDFNFDSAVNEINKLLEDREYILADEKIKKLMRTYPDKRGTLLKLRETLKGLLVKPYVEQITTLLEKGGLENVRRALEIAKNAKRHFPDDVRIQDLYKKAMARFNEEEKKEKLYSAAHKRTLEEMEKEIRQIAENTRKLDEQVRAFQERQQMEYYHEVFKKLCHAVELEDLDKIEGYLGLMNFVPQDIKGKFSLCKKKISRIRRKYNFYKHIELAKSALKIYDFSTARKELDAAKRFVQDSQDNTNLRSVLEEMEERLRFYRVQQALKTAQIYLQNSDFVSAKIVVKDILRNIDKNSKEAKMFLKQIEKAENLYYADLKLTQGIRALRAGDYQSALLLAREGLRLNSKSRELMDLYKRARERWQSEIRRKKSLLYQIEQDAEKKRRISSAVRTMNHVDKEYEYQKGLLGADIEGLLLQAQRLLDEQKFDRAIALCKKVLEYDPDNQTARDLLDLILLMQEEIDKKEAQKQQLKPAKTVLKQRSKPEISKQDLPETKISENKPIGTTISAKKIDKKTPDSTRNYEDIRKALMARVDNEVKGKADLFKRSASLDAKVASYVSQKSEEQYAFLERQHKWTLKKLNAFLKKQARLFSNAGLDRKVKRYVSRKANEQYRQYKQAEAQHRSFMKKVGREVERLASRLKPDKSLDAKIDREIKKLSEAQMDVLDEKHRWTLAQLDGFVKEKAKANRAGFIDLASEVARYIRNKSEQQYKECKLAEAQHKSFMKKVVREVERLASRLRPDKNLDAKIDREIKKLSEAQMDVLDEKHRWTLAQLDRFIKTKASQKRDIIKDISSKVRAYVEEKGREEYEAYLADLFDTAKNYLDKGRYSTAMKAVKRILQLEPDSAEAQLLKRRIVKARKDYFDRLEAERKKKEEEYRLAREHMMNEMQKEMLAKARLLSYGIDSLDEKVKKEIWTLSSIQKEREIDLKLNELDSILKVAEKNWNRIALVKDKLKMLSQDIDFMNPRQKRKVESFKDRLASIERVVAKEREKKRKLIEKRLESLRIARIDALNDGSNKKTLIREMIEKAKENLYEGNYGEVLNITEDILEIDPENSKAEKLAERARMLLKREQQVQQDQIKIEKKLYPTIREVYEKAKSAYNSGNYLKSRELFSQVISREKDAQISYYSPYAREYLDLIKEREKDIKALNREKETQELKDKIVDKLYQDAKKLEKDGKLESAAAVYENILFLFPNDSVAKEKLFAVKEKIFARDKEELQKKLDEQDKKMYKDVMKDGVVPTSLKTKKIKKEERERRRILNLPPIKKKLQQKISANFEDVPLVDVLKFFADQTGVNIIPSASVLSKEYNVSIDVKDMALESALKYLLKSYNLTYQIDEDAVWITTPDQLEKEPVETKVYHLSKGIGLYTKFSNSTSGSVELGSGASVSEVKTLKDILEEAVDWPSGSKLVLDERTGTLIVTNTPANIKKIDEILWNLDVAPVQVLIEAKFLEVDITDLSELGVEWKIANEDWATDVKGGQFSQGFAQNSGVNFSDFSNATSGLNLTYKGVLTKPQFEAVLHALEQSQNTRTLSSPRVTTLNNQPATIKVVDEWIYPTRYEFQIVQFDLNGDGDYDDAGETRYENVPTDFIKRDIGIILNVTPSVGDDMKTISLSLIPEVSDAVADYFEYTGGVKLPKFTSRNLNTNVVVDNQDTVVLGGLIRESRTKVLTKVPLLGDLPVLGTLFKKQTDSINRRNLLIFVTATVMDSQGDALVAEDE